MDKEKALAKLREAKQEALVNSTAIKVGRLELNEAMKALRTVIALQNVLKDEWWNSNFILRLEDKTMEELREYILDQDIWEREVDELLGNFNNNVTEDDFFCSVERNA